jgi:hypothetical protein
MGQRENLRQNGTNDESQRHRERDHPSLRDPLPQRSIVVIALVDGKVVAVCLKYSGETQRHRP